MEEQAHDDPEILERLKKVCMEESLRVSYQPEMGYKEDMDDDGDVDKNGNMTWKAFTSANLLVVARPEPDNRGTSLLR